MKSSLWRLGVAALVVGLASATALAFDIERTFGAPQNLLAVEDDAELGEIVFFDVVARAAHRNISEILDFHNLYDLYPEEVATALYVAQSSGRDPRVICEMRADRKMSWEDIAYDVNLAPRDMHHDSPWYDREKRNEWWRRDPEIERDVVPPLIAMVYRVSESQVRDWNGKGIGYSDLCVLLEFAARSRRSPEEIIDLKVSNRWRWETVADRLGIDLTDIYYKRSLHYHNSNFEPYDPNDHRIYHSYQRDRDHRTRREYHAYAPPVVYEDHYYHFDYYVDYDPFFTFGRTWYGWWWPYDFGYSGLYRYPYWSSPIYHPIYVYDPIYYPGPTFVPLPPSPDPPASRDRRRYAQKILGVNAQSQPISASQPLRVSDEDRQSSRKRQRDEDQRRQGDFPSSGSGRGGGDRAAPPSSPPPPPARGSSGDGGPRGGGGGGGGGSGGSGGGGGARKGGRG